MAAHIAAASPGGMRFDENMPPETRKSASNGIWMCQSCSKLIDSDSTKYTVDLLASWKQRSEGAAAEAIESPAPAFSINARIESLLEESKARSKRRIRGSGLHADQVERVWNSIIDRIPLPEFAAKRTAGKVVSVVGELGSGKSESADSLHRRDIESARDGVSPLPIWLSARRIQGSSLSEMVGREFPDRDIRERGCHIIVDELDAVADIRAVNSLYDEIVDLCLARENFDAVVTIRPGYFLPALDCVEASELSPDQSSKIMAAVSGEDRHHFNIPDAAYDVIKVPLYALIAGQELASLSGPFSRFAPQCPRREAACVCICPHWRSFEQ
ncbi:hypothetical protein [Kitasatospora griseola]|uniref:hypothetical protein n=1 Tax=Kitasatospora griseola TaxID=2064 RepID=UPI0038287BEE